MTIVTMARVARGLLLAAGLVVTVGLLDGRAARAEHAAASPAQEQIEEMIHQYLLEHPDVMIEVLEILEGRQQAAEADRARANLAAYRETLLYDPASPVAGNPDGDVTLVEFFDYHCPYCKRVMPHIEQVLREDPGLRVVFKEWPILGDDSVMAARAALASRGQDPAKYAAFHGALMSSRARLTEARVMRIAREMGFDAKRLKADMDSPEITEMIERNRQLAQALGISATPTFVIGDQIVRGAVSLETIRQLINAARES